MVLAPLADSTSEALNEFINASYHLYFRKQKVKSRKQRQADHQQFPL